MRATTFGPLVKRAAEAKGLKQGRLGYLLTEPDGTFFDSSQVRLIYQGKRRPTHDLVQKLIDILDPYLDPPEAWAAAGLLPPGVDADMLRQLDLFATVGASDVYGAVTAPRLGAAGQRDRRRRRRLWVVPALPEEKIA